MERKRYPFRVDYVEACVDSRRPANRENRVVAISSYVSGVEEVGNSGD